MSLTDSQIWELAERMSIPLVFCNFKDRLKNKKLQHNKFYIINMENEYDEDGRRNTGSHYTCFQVNKYPNGKVEGVYFDSFGERPPQIVEEFTGMKLPYSTKDIQSLMNSACGWYVLAFGHFINASIYKSGDLYTDCAFFTDLFDDLNIEKNHLKNEWILKNFFRSSDPEKRKPIEVNGITLAPPTTADPNTIITENDDLAETLK